MLEIEKKYLINSLPTNIDSYEYTEISQAYLNTNSEPVLRVRKIGNEYVLTYKYVGEEQKKEGYIECIEYELPISKEAFNNLSNKAEGNVVKKKRYYIPYNQYTIELDIFEDELQGLVIAEVEFETGEELKKFQKPAWFGKDVSTEKKYRNSSLSKTTEKFI